MMANIGRSRAPIFGRSKHHIKELVCARLPGSVCTNKRTKSCDSADTALKLTKSTRRDFKNSIFTFHNQQSKCLREVGVKSFVHGRRTNLPKGANDVAENSKTEPTQNTQDMNFHCDLSVW